MKNKPNEGKRGARKLKEKLNKDRMQKMAKNIKLKFFIVFYFYFKRIPKVMECGGRRVIQPCVISCNRIHERRDFSCGYFS